MNHDQSTDCVQERTYFVYHTGSAHLFICHSFITKIFTETVGVFLFHISYSSTLVSQSVCPSVYMNLCSTDLRSLYLSLPTTQHLTPTTPKHFLFYYFIELKVVRQNCHSGPHRLRIIFSHSGSVIHIMHTNFTFLNEF